VVDPALQCVESLSRAFASASRQGDVRTIGASLRDECTKTCCGADMLLKGEQAGSQSHTHKENPCAVEKVQQLKLYRNGRQMQFAKLFDNAFELFRAGVA